MELQRQVSKGMPTIFHLGELTASTIARATVEELKENINEVCLDEGNVAWLSPAIVACRTAGERTADGADGVYG